MDNKSGAAWLESLAAHYEDLARQLRETATRVTQAERMVVDESEPLDGVRIGEAIRQALAIGHGEPMRAAEIWTTIRKHHIKLVTRSARPRDLIDATLQSMERSRIVKRIDGRGWTLVS